MKNDTILKIILLLSIVGVLFAGFLTFTKVILGVCPLNEPCPYLFGYPVCIYGLIFFTTILISTIMLLKKKNPKNAFKTLLYVSTFAVAFSLYFSYQDLFVTCAEGWCKYSLGLPSCVYGLFMYVAILIFALIYITDAKTNKKSISKNELDKKKKNKTRRK